MFQSHTNYGKLRKKVAASFQKGDVCTFFSVLLQGLL